MKIYKFGNCVLNAYERSVVKDGKRLKLTPKTFDVLQILVEHAGEIVTKDEMLGSVWNGSFVEESNLPVQIARLRRSLKATETDRLIETAYGIGYRFVSRVRLIVQDELEDGGFTRDHNTRKELNKAAGLLFEAARSIRRLVPKEHQAKS